MVNRGWTPEADEVDKPVEGQRDQDAPYSGGREHKSSESHNSSPFFSMPKYIDLPALFHLTLVSRSVNNFA